MFCLTFHLKALTQFAGYKHKKIDMLEHPFKGHSHLNLNNRTFFIAIKVIVRGIRAKQARHEFIYKYICTLTTSHGLNYINIRSIILIRLTQSNNLNKNKKKITKKGIVLTALLVAGVIGASFLVYLLPG
jgi:hypothetical protein